MDYVQIDSPIVQSDGDRTVVSSQITVGANSHSVWYRTSGPVANDVDPFVVSSLFAAMRTGLPLRTDEPVSGQLLSNLSQVQEIFHAWDRTFKIVPIEAPVRPRQEALGTAAGCFFSGGVDSFYSALKHLRQLTALIFVHGFDIPIDEVAFRLRVGESLSNAASELGLPLVEVETNVRSLTDSYLDWGFAHGAALASVGLLLNPQLQRILIPSSYSYAELFPWGTHPLVDRLWSTERTAMVHDGCEARRLEKIASIAQHDVALRHLRVCWENPRGEYNCCKCEKCLRTMIGLQLADALDRCSTFDRPIDVQTVSQMRVRSSSAQKFLAENLTALENSASDPTLAQAIRRCLENQSILQADEEQWEKNIPLARRDLATWIQSDGLIILVDEDRLRSELAGDRPTLPFSQHNGQYGGPPVNDEAAIEELEQLCSSGAHFLVITWPAFWWLEYYSGFHRHLRDHYACLLQNERLVVFDLRGRPSRMEIPSQARQL